MIEKTNKSKKDKVSNDDINVLSMYLREINNISLLSREEEDKIANAAVHGDIVARNRLVTSNLRFVVKIAKKYQGQGLPLADLISEGNIGLINAAERYDVSRGYHFISYAVWWIRQAILKAICDKARMIRLPVNRANELIRIKYARKHTAEQNTDGEIQEIAAMLNMDRDLIVELLNISQDMVSMEVPLHSENEAVVLGDFIEDQKNCSPVQAAMTDALVRDIENVLSTLNEKEAAIIRCRYGLGSKTPMSLKEIGDRFHLTKERIRQIEKIAVGRLRNPVRMNKLQAYVA